MKINVKQEILLLLIAVAPLVYLFLVWQQIPQIIPIHYDINGNANDFGSKSTLFLIAGMGLFLYFIMLAIPFIDPKKQIENMGNKYFSIKLVTILFISALSVFLIYKTIHVSTPIQYMMVILGLFFMFLGNYLQTIKPNYFLGVRTPWTLQRDTVWIKTHKLTGLTWLVGGFVISFAYFIFPSLVASYVMIGIILILVLVPILSSYIFYKKETATDI